MSAALELRVALRYLRGHAASRLVSLITLIAVGGVTVGVMALVVVLGVMNGMQADLRDKILVANPHLRVLTYGEGLRLDDWHRVLEQVRRTPGVAAAAPFVMTQALISAGHDYVEGVEVLGWSPTPAGAPSPSCRGISPRATSRFVRRARTSKAVSRWARGCPASSARFPATS